MLKIALGQMEIIPGRPDLNTGIMLSMIAKARQANTDIIIFPEMAIPGYLLGDTWEQSAFFAGLRRVWQADYQRISKYLHYIW